MPCVTRFAPSPTGRLHLGGARTALFNWLAARASGGKFILRIDDTDRERSKQEYVDEIKHGLEWLGLNWDSEFRQSEQKDEHQAFINTLINAGFAISNNGVSITASEIAHSFGQAWVDRVVGNIARTEQDWQHIQAAKLTRTDGSALYNVASVADDICAGINLIIRGTDHITNTTLQHFLRALYGSVSAIPEVEYAHVGLIHGADGKKMAKRAGDETFFLSHYIDAGYSPDAMFNCLLRLGWGPKVDDKTTAVLTRDDALRLFLDGGNLRSAPSKFDVEKLNSWNRKFKARTLASA